MHITLLLGFALLAGLAFGRLFKRLGIPQVVGFILLGVILGDSFAHLLPQQLLNTLSPMTSLALALIGFLVGGELKHSVFGKYGKQFFAILFCEGLLAMLLVSVLASLWTGNLALGVLLGALSAATAPAATVDVLWEYRSKGPLTNTILAIVALDDGLALILYGFALAFADVLVSNAPFSLEVMLLEPLREICGSVLLGGFFGFVLDKMLRLFDKKDDQLVATLGCILAASGITLHFDLSLILTNMVTGLYLTNVHPDRHESVFELMRSFGPPILIIFFVFVGARLQLGLLPKMGMIGLLYVAGRTAGKWIGSYIGARFSDAPETVRKYLGFALFSQAGVAIGLSLDIYEHFAPFGAAGVQLGQTIISVVAATTFLVQIIGPPSVKYAITKAGEVG